MTKPTRGEVVELMYCAKAWVPEARLLGNVKAETIGNICESYLAQEEELDQLNADLRYYKSVAENQTGLKLKLEAENQALKEQYDKLEQSSQQIIAHMAIEAQALKASIEAGYIERQAKHIQELVKENGALKDKGEQLCCRVGVLEMENQELKTELLRLEA